MDLDQIPLFAMLKGKLSYTSQRQQLIAGNVANADVPGYAPRDLKPFSVTQAMQGAGGPAASMGVAPVPFTRTSAAHLDIASASTAVGQATNAPDSEVRLDGNRVVLEEQMVKMSDARMDYDAAIGFYQQSLNMLRTAIRKPGQ
ncbi:MAG: flagellar basal body rod protein FlgB [Pseudomonadota bacterium]|nr:flagellar basal body rod protein FlgB [Pseudomonadota bacterium]